MKTGKLCLWTVALAVVTGFMSSPSHAERTLPGSFLKWRVSNSAELAKQIDDSAEVARRYQAFYKQDPSVISERFQGLHVMTLSKQLTTRVHFISKSGKISSKTTTFLPGALVFADANNKPVLDYKCGNPMSSDLPSVEKVMSEKTPEVSTDLPMSGQGAEVPVDVQMTEVASSTAVPNAEPIFTEVLAQPTEVFTGAATVGPATATTATTAVEAAPVAVAAGGGPVGLLAAVPLLFLGGGGGGGGGGPVVPEPSTILTLGASLSAFAGLAIRRKRH
ncbi:MAG: PEP-CTERM sorting domain-containing protein [Armatimonadetes bacterium]|nr:PEP-CTERM sorting domain-containing protein [Armatimonadota bacterium]